MRARVIITAAVAVIAIGPGPAGASVASDLAKLKREVRTLKNEVQTLKTQAAANGKAFQTFLAVNYNPLVGAFSCLRRVRVGQFGGVGQFDGYQYDFDLSPMLNIGPVTALDLDASADPFAAYHRWMVVADNTPACVGAIVQAAAIAGRASAVRRR